MPTHDTRDFKNRPSDRRPELQDAQYAFPYHHIPRLENGNYRQDVHLRWGYEYFSYLHLVVDNAVRLAPARILDVGCGDGRIVRELAKRLPGAVVTGIDVSERAIAVGRALNPTLDLRCADITRGVPEPGEFDLVTLVEVLEHVAPEHADPFLRAVHGSLSTSGRLLLTVPSTNVSVNQKHYRHFDETSLRSALSEYFEIERLEFINKNSIALGLALKILDNSWFRINNRFIWNQFMSLYRKHLTIASPRDARRLFVVARRM